MDLWEEAIENIKIEDFKGYKCWGGLDLSSNKDITAFVLVFYKEETDKYYIFPFLFTAKDTVMEREEKDKNPYSDWIRKGDLIPTEGKYIKFNDMLDKMIKLKEDYDIERIGFDRFGSPTILNVLENEFDVETLGQGTATMTMFINSFENLLIDGRLVIAKNNLFTFMAKNCVAVYNEQLDCKYSKKKSKFKIDGIIAMLMALGLAVDECDIEYYNPLEALDKLDWD